MKTIVLRLRLQVSEPAGLGTGPAGHCNAFPSSIEQHQSLPNLLSYLMLIGHKGAAVAKHSGLIAASMLGSLKGLELLCLNVRSLQMIRNFVCFVQVLP